MAVFKRSWILNIQIGDVVKTYKEMNIDESSLKIEFTINQTANNSISNGEITIYGLNLNDMQLLSSAGMPNNAVRDNAISLEAGYFDNIALLIKGNFSDVVPDYETPGNKITLKIQSGLQNNLKNNYVTTSLENEVDFKEVCEAVAKNNNLTLNYQVTEPKKIYDYSFSGTPIQQVYNLRTYFNNVFISIDSVKDVLNVVGEHGDTKKDAYTLSNKSGLIGTPKPTVAGVQCVSLLNTNFYPNRLVNLQNANLTSLDGKYRIVELKHQGSNQGLDWITQLVMVKV